MLILPKKRLHFKKVLLIHIQCLAHIPFPVLPEREKERERKRVKWTNVDERARTFALSRCIAEYLARNLYIYTHAINVLAERKISIL